MRNIAKKLIDLLSHKTLLLYYVKDKVLNPFVTSYMVLFMETNALPKRSFNRTINPKLRFLFKCGGRIPIWGEFNLAVVTHLFVCT